MRTSVARLYAPFLAIVLVQALLVAVAPSSAPEQQALTGGPGAEGGTGNFGDVTGSDEFGGPTGGTSTGTGSVGTTSSGGSSGSSGGGPAGSGAAGSSGGSSGGGTQAAGDTSHCTPDGKQHDVTFNAPPCVPKWPDGADNGGVTYQGVTADKIKVIYFTSESNPLVNQILASQGLAASDEEFQRMNDAAVRFLNEHYELYGREIEWEHFQGTCPQTPPDPDACRQAANEVVKKKPFMVIFGTPLYPTIFDEWTRAGIISLGGWHFDESQFTKRRPFRYDVFMDGTRSANLIAEYFCKKLAGKNASHAGQIIHASIGPRSQTERKLGIIVPDTATNKATANTVIKAVQGCGGQIVGEPFAYQSNIETAQQQSTATTAALIDAEVTTVVCMCDPIAPRFATQEATNQQYFPEWLVPGLGLLDYDLVGRLYDQEQWRHAFGPSHLGTPVPAGQEDASKIWREGGESGNACGSCGVFTAYWLLAGAMLQASGPELHPLNIENNIVGAGYTNGGWEATGRDPTLTMTRFGPGDYTALEDAREVIWRPQRTSPVDGRPGAYEPLHGGRRYENGSWPAAFDVPPPTGG